MKRFGFSAVLLAMIFIFTGCAPVGGDTDKSVETGNTQSKAVTDTPYVDSDTETDKEVVIPPSYELQFTNDKNGIYNYCPSVMQMSDGTLYSYYCTNTVPYQVVDYIGCRKGVRDEDGEIEWGEESIVLSPTKDTWDGHHVCDPSVIVGQFSYRGESYGYLMAYLGCTSYDNQENKIGLAVSKTPEGPFIKVGDSPLVDFVKDLSVSVFQWGVGQPSLISKDGQGSVYMFYTRGDKNGTRLIVDEWELSSLDAPEKIKTFSVSAKGLTNLNGEADFMNNADLAYDNASKRFYAVSDCHPNPSDTPDYISSHFRITSFAELYGISEAYWRTERVVSPDDTGYPRNHNTGILRDEHGHLPNNGYLTVFYTVSTVGADSLWSYRIPEYHIAIK